MKLSKEQIESFQIAYKEQFGVELRADEALEKALKVLRLFQLVLFPEETGEA